MVVAMNKIVQKDVFLKINFIKIPDKIKQPTTIPIIITPPKTRPDIFIPSETCTNLIIKLVKSAMDMNPNTIANFLSVIIAGKKSFYFL